MLTEQQKPGSPNFRKWLTPEGFADRFGVSQPDIDKITGWLKSQGFDIITVGRGRRFIAFNATAQQVQSALKTGSVAKPIDWFALSDTWNRQHQSYPTQPHGDSYASALRIAQELHLK